MPQERKGKNGSRTTRGKNIGRPPGSKDKTPRKKAVKKPRKPLPQTDDGTLQHRGEVVPMRGNEPYKKYDWDKIKAQYIEGVPKDVSDPDGDRDWLTLKEISERLGVPYQRIRERSSRERWPDQRNAYQQKIITERQQQRAKKLAGQATEFDDKALDVAKLGAQLIHARLGEIVQDVHDRRQLRDKAIAARQQGMAIDINHLKTAIHSSELERLAKSMQSFQEIGMKALGTDVERHQIEGNVNVDQTVSVRDELERDDPKRLAGFIAVAQRSGFFGELMKELEEEAVNPESGDIVDAEVVEDDLPETVEPDEPETSEDSTETTDQQAAQQPEQTEPPDEQHDSVVENTKENDSENTNETATETPAQQAKRRVNIKRK